MDVHFINPFVESTCNTFQTMCALKVTVGQPVLKNDNDRPTDVSSVIGFSGEAAGSFVLHFAFDTASTIATAFAGIDITPEHPDFSDAIGELANMIAGDAKSKFEGLNINISLPNVIIGRNHRVAASKNTPRILIPFLSDVGVFYVEIGMVLGRTQSGATRQVATAGANA